ncbi:MAG: hypothetical protein LBP81_02835 [Treponema sp.]|jgi:hypothetical protein|nr:hypothetical protein [Treponema sp.]
MYMKDMNKDLYAMMQRYPPNSPAWSLADAFDAVTNGMDNPESFARMEELTESQLQPWKRLIHGIRSLYSGDIPGCQAAMEAIDDRSAPGALKPIFKAWIVRQGAGFCKAGFSELSGAGRAVSSLYRRLIVEPHPLSLLAEQAEEALNHGLAEQFAFLAGKVMKSLQEQKRGDGPLLAVRYVRYCLKLLDKAGREDADFFSVAVKNLGEADGFCALGFALIGKDNNAAVAALEKALSSGGGPFLDAAMASLIAGFLPALKQRAVRGRRISSGQPRRAPDVYGSKYPVSGSRKAAGQLELFGENYG